MITRDMAEAVRIQGRVLLALMLREARTRYGRTKAGYLWALLEPIIHISMLYFLFKYRLRMVAIGDNIPIFLATGFLTYIGFRNVMNRTGGGYGSNEALLSFPIVKVMDVFVGRALLELGTWIAVTFILLGGLIALGYGPLPRDVITMLIAVLALFLIGFGVGTFIGIASEFVPAIGSFMRVPQRLLYFTSGLFFLPEALPPAARDILAWNPILHGITLFREGYFPSYDSYVLDVQYLFGWAVGSVLLALVTERVARKPMRNLA